MYRSHLIPCLVAILAALLASGKGAATATQGFQGLFEMARIGDALSRGEHGELFQSKVNPNGASLSDWHLCRNIYTIVAQDRGEILSSCCAAYGYSLDLANTLTADDGPNLADLRNPNKAITNNAALRNSEFLLSAFCLEARKTLFSFEESNEGRIKICQCRLKALRVNLREPCSFVFLFPPRKKPIYTEPTEILAFFCPQFDLHRQSMIVEPPNTAKMLGEQFVLGYCWINSVSKSNEHGTLIALNLNQINVNL